MEEGEEGRGDKSKKSTLLGRQKVVSNIHLSTPTSRQLSRKQKAWWNQVKEVQVDKQEEEKGKRKWEKKRG